MKPGLLPLAITYPRWRLDSDRLVSRPAGRTAGADLRFDWARGLSPGPRAHFSGARWTRRKARRGKL